MKEKEEMSKKYNNKKSSTKRVIWERKYSVTCLYFKEEKKQSMEKTLKNSCKINIYITKCPAIPNTIQYYYKTKIRIHIK